MQFHVVAIKEINQKKINLEFLIEAEKEELLRNVFIEAEIVLLELAPYQWLRASFQKYYLDLGFVDSRGNLVQNLYFRVIPKSSNIEKTILLFLFCGFLVQNFNYLAKDKQLNQKDIDTTLKKLNKKITYFLQQQKTVAQKYQKTKENLYSNKNLDLTRKVLENMVLEIEDFLEKYKDAVSPNKIKPLSEIKEELKKLKLWSNEEKIAEDFDIAFSLMQQIELLWLSSRSLDMNVVFDKTLISYFDIDHELRVFDRAQKMKLIWWKISSSDNYYLTFNKLWFYFKFILIDIKNFFSKIQSYIRLWLKYFSFSLLLSLIFLMIYFIIMSLFLSSDSWLLFLIMIFLWELGLLLYLYLFISKKWENNVLLLGLVGVLFVFVFVFNLTISNFAL